MRFLSASEYELGWVDASRFRGLLLSNTTSSNTSSSQYVDDMPFVLDGKTAAAMVLAFVVRNETLNDNRVPKNVPHLHISTPSVTMCVT